MLCPYCSSSRTIFHPAEDLATCIDCQRFFAAPPSNPQDEERLAWNTFKE